MPVCNGTFPQHFWILCNRIFQSSQICEIWDGQQLFGLHNRDILEGQGEAKQQHWWCPASSRAPLPRALLSSLCTLLKSQISCSLPLFAALPPCWPSKATFCSALWLWVLESCGLNPRLSSTASFRKCLGVGCAEDEVSRTRTAWDVSCCFPPLYNCPGIPPAPGSPPAMAGKRGLFPFIPLSSARRQRAGCNSNLHTINFCRFYSPHWSGIKQHRVETLGAGNGGAGCCPGVCTATHFTPLCPSAGTALRWGGGGNGTSTTQSASYIDPCNV